jgi:membrane fusion protein, multidrug efflux system
MFRDREQLSAAAERQGEWVNFPPSPEAADPAQALAENRKPGPHLPIPVEPGGPNQGPKVATRGREVKPRRRGRALIVAAALLAALGAGGYFGSYWWTVGRFQVSTDDAYVGAKSATLAAKIPGYIATLAVDDNQHVRAGDIIARIDDGDYRLAVDAAREKVATQKATIERIGQQIAAQQAAVEQANALVASARAGATRARLELDRQQALASKEFASRQRLEQAQADRDQTIAAVDSAKAQAQSATANVEVLKGQQEEAARTLKELETSLAKAERDLSFAVIRAPFDGVVGNRAVQTGDYVQPGQRLASLVPLDEVYVDANFKETQVARLRPGQTVRITVDALPDHRLEGSVVSFAPASGSVFSLLPPDNATGNFTKIVQRLPVRIEVPAEVARKGLLRPGMSVVVSVDTRSGAPGNRSLASR